jgi:RpiR family transcriptional regulator, carbohydrate utilization regulator
VNATADVPRAVLAAIRARMPGLPSGERRVAEAIVDQPYAAISWSAQELAEAARTSSPTVVRACRRLGFAGLPELRLALAREVGWARLAVESDDGGSHRATAMFTSAVRSLSAIGEHLDLDAIDAAAALLVEAQRVVFVCAGPTQVVCRDAMFDLLTIGRPAEFTDDAIVQRLVAAGLSTEDVCIAVGVSGENEQTVQAARAAKEAGARVLVLTSSPRSTLSRLGDVSIHVSAPNILPQTHGTAVLLALMLALRSITATIAQLLPEAPVPDLGSPFVRAGHPSR